MPDEYMSEYTIKTPSFDLPEPIRVGYKFKGWYANDEFKGKNWYKIVHKSTGDLELYAK